jgi:tetratricopeptide (TPR) repeat protein
VGHLERAVARLTSRHPNPVTGEAHYFLGLALLHQGHLEAAYPLFYKATWNYEWRSSAYYHLACLDCLKSDFESALEHLDQSLATNRDHNKAKTLTALVLKELGREDEAFALLDDLLALDPLDHWARHVRGDDEGFLAATRNDAQTILDLVFDYSDAGFQREALELLALHESRDTIPCAVPNPLERSQMTAYAKAWLTGNSADLAAARSQESAHFFPSRIHEQTVLEWAMAQTGDDTLAAYGLGNYYYDLRRHEDALRMWQIAAKADNPQAHRNLGLAHWNLNRDGEAARASYLKAIELDESDARLVSEFDQLCQKLNDPLESRLEFLEAHRGRVLQRDDATVALASLYNLLGRPQDALDLLLSRRFHPWEGGEGAVLKQYSTARLLLGQEALECGDAELAHEHFTRTTETPESLGEAYHLLQAKADVNYWIGRSLRAMGREDEAIRHFEMSAEEEGDFSEMAVTSHSPLSYYRGLSLRELGRQDEARSLFESLARFAEEGLNTEARIDYFATSLPNLLVFEEDLQQRRDAEHHLLLALAHHGLDEPDKAEAALARTLSFTLTDPMANMLSRCLSLQST